MKVIGKEFVAKEKVAEGEIFEPEGIVLEKGFNAEWGGHRFTDEEVERLLRGEEITIVTGKGNEVTGKLGKDEYKGHEYWGFRPEKKEVKEKVAAGREFEPTGETLKKGFNAEWGGHRFTDEEVERLLRGEEIVVITADGKPVPGVLGQSVYKKHSFWGFHPGIPNTLAGHVFSADEKERMYAGEMVFVEDFWSKTKARYYSAWVTWDWSDMEVVMDFGDDEAKSSVPEDTADDIEDGDE